MNKYLIYYKINVSDDLIHPIYEEYNAVINGYENGLCKDDILEFRNYAKENHNTKSNPIIMNIIKLRE